MLDWWLASLSGSTSHVIDDVLAWHGRLMVLAWSVLAPVALLWARYWKIAPRQDFPRVLDDKRWWHAHRGLQSLAALCTAISLWLVWRDGGATGATSVAQVHHWLGWAVCVAVAAQIAHGLGRGSKGGPTDAQMRGDHFDMTLRRVAFERVHKSLGWLTLAAAWIATLLGLWLADAPRWMVIAVLGWWLLLAVAWVRWQRSGLCIDTYQTIWGTAAHLPGMARAPVGWGVRRYTSPTRGHDTDADRKTSMRDKGM